MFTDFSVGAMFPELVDNAPSIRATFSKSVILFFCISAALHQRIQIKDIYAYIELRYRFITQRPNWKNNIRQLLSNNKNFVLVRRPFFEPGKGDYWTLSEHAYFDEKTRTLRSNAARRQAAQRGPNTQSNVMAIDPLYSMRMQHQQDQNMYYQNMILQPRQPIHQNE